MFSRPIKLAMEPERKIEKLLRAYARKRRAGAGDPLKLHPATRRVLQDEVTRSTKPQVEEPSLSLWRLFRQQWAFLLGFALMIFLGATLLLPTLRSAKREAQSISAMNNLRQIGTAAQIAAARNEGKLPLSLDVLTNELLPSRALADPATGKPFVYVAAGENLDALQSNNVLAYSPVSKDGSAVLFADGRVEFATRSRLSELTNQNSSQVAFSDKMATTQFAKANPATPPAAASAPAAQESESGIAQGRLGAGAAQSFVQTTAGSVQQNFYRNEAVSAQSAPILQSFQVVQNGDKVSVVDQDGSIYRGSVLATHAMENNEPVLGEIPTQAAAPVEGQAKQIQLAGNQGQAAQNYFFRVAGMNRTLKQNVTFSGRMEMVPGEQPTVRGISGGGGAGGEPVQTNVQTITNLQQQLSQSLRVVGTAMIGPTNRISVNAVPAAP